MIPLIDNQIPSERESPVLRADSASHEEDVATLEAPANDATTLPVCSRDGAKGRAFEARFIRMGLLGHERLNLVHHRRLLRLREGDWLAGLSQDPYNRSIPSRWGVLPRRM